MHTHTIDPDADGRTCKGKIVFVAGHIWRGFHVIICHFITLCLQAYKDLSTQTLRQPKDPLILKYN